MPSCATSISQENKNPRPHAQDQTAILHIGTRIGHTIPRGATPLRPAQKQKNPMCETQGSAPVSLYENREKTINGEWLIINYSPLIIY
jgi:hypothetical protein